MKITIIGAGEMGGAFATGLLKGSVFAPSDITVAEPNEARLKKFAERGAHITTDNRSAIQGADIIAIVVKPAVVASVIAEIEGNLDYQKQIIINMAASVTIDQLEEWLNRDGNVPAIFQVIPNIGIEERASMTFIAPNTTAASRIETVKDLFDALGETLITSESLLIAGTAVSSCGIAYIMRYVRAASEAGVELGFRADDAKNIVIQTMNGAVKLLQSSMSHPEVEIDKVTTPGGMTIRGLNAMECHGFSSSVIEGIKASLKK